MATLAVGDKGNTVALLQALLCRAGHDASPIDGDFGPATTAAVRGYQSENGLWRPTRTLPAGGLRAPPQP